MTCEPYVEGIRKKLNHKVRTQVVTQTPEIASFSLSFSAGSRNRVAYSAQLKIEFLTEFEFGSS